MDDQRSETDSVPVFTTRMVRELKGAPISCLFLLFLASMPVSNEWLCMMSGYSDKTISHALSLLSSPEYQIASRTGRGWILAKGLQLNLPLIKRRNSVSATAAINLIDINTEDESVAVGRKFSDSLEENENPNFQENLKMCKRLGIGEPSASKISSAFSPMGEAVAPAFIQAHVDSLQRGQGIGLAIVRILNDELPRAWQREIEELPGQSQICGQCSMYPCTCEEETVI